MGFGGSLAASCLAALMPLQLLGACLGVAAQGAATPLEVAAPKSGERVELDGGAARYELRGLLPSSSYEVRVSYPATIPAYVSIGWEGGAGKGGARRRRLLNVDKMVFWTDGAGGVAGRWGGQPPRIEVAARREGVHVDGALGGPSHLTYNIVLAPMYMGVLPQESVAVVAGGLLSLLVVALVAPRWARFARAWAGYPLEGMQAKES